MRFSITIPAFKGRFLREAIESVLNQSFLDFELIVVNDDSPEDLDSVVSPFLSDARLRYYRNSNNIGALNVVDNWNHCLELSRGDYIICMGDDDKLCKDCLKEYDSLISKYPSLKLFHGQTEIIDESGEVIEVLEKRPEFESEFEMVFRRWNGRKQYIGDFCFEVTRLRSVGGFYKLPLAWGSDDISSYMSAKGIGVANTERTVFQYRQNSLTISSDKNYSIKLAAMAASHDWFSAELGTARASDSKAVYYLSELKKILEDHFTEYYKVYVRDDVSQNWRRGWYWMSHSKECRLGVVQAIWQSIKGLIK